MSLRDYLGKPKRVRHDFKDRRQLAKEFGAQRAEERQKQIEISKKNSGFCIPSPIKKSNTGNTVKIRILKNTTESKREKYRYPVDMSQVPKLAFVQDNNGLTLTTNRVKIAAQMQRSTSVMKKHICV